MKKDMLNILCCPTCKGDLKVDIKKEVKDDIVDGVFNFEILKKN